MQPVTGAHATRHWAPHPVCHRRERRQPRRRDAACLRKCQTRSQGPPGRAAARGLTQASARASSRVASCLCTAAASTSCAGTCTQSCSLCTACSECCWAGLACYLLISRWGSPWLNQTRPQWFLPGLAARGELLRTCTLSEWPLVGSSWGRRPCRRASLSTAMTAPVCAQHPLGRALGQRAAAPACLPGTTAHALMQVTMPVGGSNEGHLVCFSISSTALRTAGAARTHPSAPGVVKRRRPASGRPTGQAGPRHLR